MTRLTTDQKNWHRAHAQNMEAAREKMVAKAAEHLMLAFNAMSESESNLNTCMKHAGHDTYALSRNKLNENREMIRSLATQFGARSSEYPLRLVGGDYSSLE